MVIKEEARARQLLLEQNYTGIDFYNFLPAKNDTPKILGNFEFIKVQNWRDKIYYRYIGTDKAFAFIHAPPSADNTKRYSYSYTNTSSKLTIKGHDYVYLCQSTPPDNLKSNTSGQSFVGALNKRRKEFNPSLPGKLGSTDEIKQFKAALLVDKQNWESKRNEIVQSVFNMTYEEYNDEKYQLVNAEDTKFVLKISPMLSRLRDECDAVLLQFGDKKGPTKAAKEDFTRAYKAFMGWSGNRTYLTKLKTFKKKETK